MEIIKSNLNVQFMAQRKVALAFSLIMVLGAIIAVSLNSLKFGLDFTGGTLIEVEFEKVPEISVIRSQLEQSGFDDAVIQNFGSAKDVLVRLAPREDKTNAKLSSEVINALKSLDYGHVTQRRVEFVGPQVGDELAEDGGLAMLFALIGILIYVTVRFEKRFSLGSVIALIHDVTIIIGFFAIFQLEFDLTVLAALLAIIGYSLNDTIVVYDRIRENFRTMRKGTPEEIINVSINQTLTRTIMTSLTTVVVVVSLFVFGGPIIHNFALSLLLGIIVGTYSSIYVASSAALMLGVSKQDLIPVEVERDEVDVMP